MIIEGAFLKIPEVLLNYDDKNDLYEANIVNVLTNAIILEFNARNIDNPLTKLQLERRYNKKENIRCDLFANFDFINEDLKTYGYFKENWIEAKYFGNYERTKGTQTKSENAASIMFDLYRLAKNTNRTDHKGLYSLNIFSHNPTKYLAFHRQDGTQRNWLRKILTCGINETSFNLDEEPYTVQKVFHKKALKFTMKTRTLLFEPLDFSKGDFFGYLIQILSFELI